MIGHTRYPHGCLPIMRQGLARGRAKVRVKGEEQGRLAGPAVAGKGDTLALPHLELQDVEDLYDDAPLCMEGEGLRQPRRPYHRSVRHRSPLPHACRTDETRRWV